MFGLIGTVCVVLQMALLATNYGAEAAMAIGLVGCGAWIAHSVKHKDKWLFTTNGIVAMFAVYGLA